MFATQAWIVIVASYLATVFAFACPQDFRSDSAAYVGLALSAFLIRTFLFHLGLFLAAVAAAAALTRRWRLLAAAAPLIAFALAPALWSYAPRRPAPVVGEAVTIMSANLLHANEHTDPIVDEVLAAQPDLLLLQEYTPSWHRSFQAALAGDYPHARYVVRDDSFGVAVYSKRPFAEPVKLDVRLGTLGLPQARAVVQIGERAVALYSVHLLPPKRLSWVIEQRREYADLLEQLEREKLPTILCGDFNFTNASVFADELVRRGMIDAHRISGRGRGSTWLVSSLFRYLPGIRLDHIFLSRELTSTWSRTGTGRGSDHRPVIAEIGFARQPR